MPKGRNAKEARRESRYNRRDNPRQNGHFPGSRIMPPYESDDDSDDGIFPPGLMMSALMARAMQQFLNFDSDDCDDCSDDDSSDNEILTAKAGKSGLPDQEKSKLEELSKKLNQVAKLKRKDCERKAKIEDVKDWPVQPRSWGSSDKNNILLIQLKNMSFNSKVDPATLTPGQITRVVMYNDIFHKSSQCPRIDLENKFIAVYIDDPSDMSEMLKVKLLSLDLTDMDHSCLEENEKIAVHCFRPQAKTKDERWWEDKKKCFVINQHKPLTFSNDQEFEESHFYPIASWSHTLKRNEEFFLGLCQRCSNFPAFSQKMVVCNGCHLVAYCNKNCLKKDRNNHKKLCNTYSVNQCNMNVFERAMSDVRKISNAEKRREYFFIFLCNIDSNPNKVRDPPLKEEQLDYLKNLTYGLKKPFFNGCLEYPRICNVCCNADKTKLKECECFCVAYCSEDHRISDIKHKLVCKDLRKIARVYAFCKKKSVEEQNLFTPLNLEKYLGEDVLKNMCSMDDLIDPSNFPSGSKPDEWLDVKLALLSQRLSMPLTILHLLQKGGLGPKKKSVDTVEKLNIHIMCEEPFLDPLSWEFFIHQLPHLKKLNLTFCPNNNKPGGSVNHLNTTKKLQQCHNCEAAGKIITFTLYPGLYKHLVMKDKLEEPDVVYVIDPEDLVEPEEEDTDDNEMGDIQKEFYKNITKFKNSGLIIANECKRKMYKDYRSLCKHYSVQMVKLNGFSYTNKNPFSGFSPVRRRFEDRSNPDDITNNQLYVAYLVHRGENDELCSDDAADIWDVDVDDDDNDDDWTDDSDASDLPGLIDEDDDDDDMPDLVEETNKW